MVLLLIVVLWAVFLGPGLVRRLVEKRSGDSIGSFHRQLGVLRRTGPKSVAPVNKLGTADAPDALPIGATGLPVVSSRPNLVILRSDSSAVSQRGQGSFAGPSRAGDPRSEVFPAGSPGSGSANDEDDSWSGDHRGSWEAPSGRADRPEPSDTRHTDPYFRPAACKRRRDILLFMVCLVLGTGLLGVIPAARPALVVTALSALVLGAYIALLVHFRNVVVERESKLRYLPAAAPDEPELIVRRSAAR